MSSPAGAATLVFPPASGDVRAVAQDPFCPLCDMKHSMCGAHGLPIAYNADIHNAETYCLAC